MKVAITGGTGFIGRYVLRHLVSQGHNCRCWYRRDSDRTDLGDIDMSLEWFEGELNGGAEFAFLAGCDAVVHAALYHPGGGFRGGEGELIDFAERNMMGSLRLIEAAYRTGLSRFIFVSTCAVHEKILDDRPLDEAHPLWSTSHYGAHKAAIEKFVHSYGLGAGFPVCAIRPTGVYGVAHQKTESKWYGLVDDVLNGRAVSCQRGGKEVHARDVAVAIGILLTAESIAGEAYNCYDQYVSHWDVAHIAKEITGSSSRIEGSQTQPKHQIETGKLRSLGMRFGGDQLLRETIRDLARR